MHRRDFLKSSAMATVALAATTMAATSLPNMALAAMGPAADVPVFEGLHGYGSDHLYDVVEGMINPEEVAHIYVSPYYHDNYVAKGDTYFSGAVPPLAKADRVSETRITLQ